MRARMGANNSRVAEAFDPPPSGELGREQELWRPRDWRKAAGGMASSTFYALPDALRPRSAKVGEMRFILESPAQWLKRVGRSFS